MSAPSKVSAGRPTECLRCGLAFERDEPVVPLASGAGWAHATCPPHVAVGEGPAVACQHCGRAGPRRGPLRRVVIGDGEPVWICRTCTDPGAAWTLDEVLAKAARRRAVGLPPDLTLPQAVPAVGALLALRRDAGEPLRQDAPADRALATVSAALRDGQAVTLPTAEAEALLDELRRRTSRTR